MENFNKIEFFFKCCCEDIKEFLFTERLITFSVENKFPKLNEFKEEEIIGHDIKYCGFCGKKFDCEVKSFNKCVLNRRINFDLF
jgi:hypothetical protein